MIKTSDPAIKDGLGIVARLIVIAILLSVLGTILQGCGSRQAPEAVLQQELKTTAITVVQEIEETPAPFFL